MSKLLTLFAVFKISNQLKITQNYFQKQFNVTTIEINQASSNLEKVKEKDKLPVTIKEELPKITQDYSTKNDMDNTTSSLEEIFNPPLEDLKAEVINEPEKESTKICPIPGHC